MSPLDRRLSELSAHERALAQAQLARAEAIADAVAGLAAVVRGVSGALSAAGRSYTRRLTRRWPHAKGPTEPAEFPSIGLQH